MTNSSTINTNSQANLQNTQLQTEYPSWPGDVNSGKIDLAGLAGLNVTSAGISEQGVILPPVTETELAAMKEYAEFPADQGAASMESFMKTYNDLLKV
jgi:hypothetical protein